VGVAVAPTDIQHDRTAAYSLAVEPFFFDFKARTDEELRRQSSTANRIASAALLKRRYAMSRLPLRLRVGNSSAGPS